MPASSRLSKKAAITVRAVLRKPTLIAQLTNAVGSLILVFLLTRSLPAIDFGYYSAVVGVYAFGNALVGTSLGVRVIGHLASEKKGPVGLSVTGEGVAWSLCVVIVVAVSLMIGVPIATAAFAAAGMAGILSTEAGMAVTLGRKEFWTYARLNAINTVILDGGVAIAALAFRPGLRFDAVLSAYGLSAAPFVWYLSSRRPFAMQMRPSEGTRSGVSTVGWTNLALWIVASGDRVVLAREAKIALPLYAAIYGLLDRIFRTFASAEIQQRLPAAFSETTPAQRARLAIPWKAGGLLLGLVVVVIIGAPEAINLISGGRYRPPLWMAATLTVAMVEMLVAVPFYIQLLASEQTRVTAMVATTAAVVNLGGNLALDSVWGTHAAALLTLAGYSIWLLGVVVATRRHRSRGRPDSSTALTSSLTPIEASPPSV